MKFSNLTYRQKNKYLLAGTILFAILIYFIAISDTITLYTENSRIENKVKQAETAPVGIANLRKSLESLNDKLNRYLIDTTREHQHTLEVVSEFCHKNKLTVKELPQRTVTLEKDYTIITTVLKIEGTYTNLLRLLYELEYKQRIGRLSAVSWKSKFDNKSKKNILTMTVYIQNITVNQP